MKQYRVLTCLLLRTVRRHPAFAGRDSRFCRFVCGLLLVHGGLLCAVLLRALSL